eukprot:scaffold431_cov334-Pavlova_lutheri.AAC.76
MNPRSSLEPWTEKATCLRNRICSGAQSDAHSSLPRDFGDAMRLCSTLHTHGNTAGRKRGLATRAQRRQTSASDEPMSPQEWMRRKRAGAKLEELPSIMEMKDRSIGEWWERLPARMVEGSIKKSAFEEELQKLADDKFKGLRNWKEVHGELRRMKIKSVDPEELRSKVASGKVVLIDVREPEKFEAGHIQNAVNVPLYTSGITGQDAWDKLRKAAFAGFAMKGTSARNAGPIDLRELPFLLSCIAERDLRLTPPSFVFPSVQAQKGIQPLWRTSSPP